MFGLVSYFLTKHSSVFAAGMPNFSVVYFRKFLIPVKSNSGKIHSKVSDTENLPATTVDVQIKCSVLVNLELKIYCSGAEGDFHLHPLQCLHVN